MGASHAGGSGLKLGSAALPWRRLLDSPPSHRPACLRLQPGLGDMLLCLLGTLGATQQLLRSTASLAPRQLSLGPWRGNSDSAASASESPACFPAGRQLLLVASSGCCGCGCTHVCVQAAAANTPTL